jgi:mono/diheme cytochrome c family protein
MEVLMLNVTRLTRRFISGLAALTVAALLSPAIIAGTNPPKGNEGKGRYYFRQTCKDCHTKGAKGGEVTPLTKTQAQWRAYFLKGKHAGGVEPLTKVMPAAQILDVQTFLVNHAADSLQPETCGK